MNYRQVASELDAVTKRYLAMVSGGKPEAGLVKWLAYASRRAEGVRYVTIVGPVTTQLRRNTHTEIRLPRSLTDVEMVEKLRGLAHAWHATYGDRAKAAA